MSEEQLPNEQRQLLAFARIFLVDQDQFPTLEAAAKRFGHPKSWAFEHYAKLAKNGFIERNCLGKWRFKREPDSGFSPLS